MYLRVGVSEYMPINEKSRPALGVHDSSFDRLCSFRLNDCIFDNISQLENIDDSLSSELNNKFQPKKLDSLLLSDSYKRLGLFNKSDRVAQCGTSLEFRKAINSDGSLSEAKLQYANFCKDRLCPTCSWRRSYKIFAQVSAIMDYLKSQNLDYLFLTLTVPNVAAAFLKDEVDVLFSSWHRLSNTRKFKGAVLGYFRVLEITYNQSRNDFHPHFHVVLAVSKSYFKHDDYISRSEWLEMWQKATRDNSISQVDIRKVRNKYDSSDSECLSSAVAEIAKYSVKSSDYLKPYDTEKTDFLVKVFSDVLWHRRLCQFGGVFKKAYQDLLLDDMESENADLVHLERDKINPELSYLIVRVGWSAGCYKMIDSSVVSGADLIDN